MRNIPFAFRAVLAALFLASLPLLSQAQSSVQVFGTVDLNFTYSKAGGKSVRAMDQGGNIFPLSLIHI